MKRMTALGVLASLALVACTPTPTTSNSSTATATSVEQSALSDYPTTMTTPFAPIPVGTAAPSQPIHDYAKAIREKIQLTSPHDTDADGAKDIITVDIVRPATAEKVPVILMASPYSLSVAPHLNKKRDAKGIVVGMPGWYDNYFVPRGYAYAQMDIPGTALPDGGCSDYYGPHDTGAMVQTLDYLAGVGEGTSSDGATGKATWSTGAIGMIGTSSPGINAIAAASTGHPALKAIIPISAAGDVYQTIKPAGVGRTVQGALTGQIYEGEAHAWCQAAGQAINQQMTDEWSDFWAVRDHTPVKGRWHAATLQATGFRDTAVPAIAQQDFWTALSQTDAEHRVWVLDAEHHDPVNLHHSTWVPMVQRWFDHYLKGVDNGVEKDPLAHVQNGTTFRDLPAWPTSTPQTWAWTSTTDLASGTPKTSDAAVGTITMNPESPEGEPLEGGGLEVLPLGEANQHRVVVASAPLTAPLTLQGAVTVKVRLQSPTTLGSVQVGLVEFGQATRPDLFAKPAGGPTYCLGEKTAQDSHCRQDGQVPTRQSAASTLSNGYLDLRRLDGAHADLKDLTPGTWVDATIHLAGVSTTIPAGRQLGLVFTSGGMDYTDGADIAVGTGSVDLPVVS